MTLRDFKMAMLGVAMVFFWQWMLGVPGYWAPDRQMIFALAVLGLCWLFGERRNSEETSP